MAFRPDTGALLRLIDAVAPPVWRLYAFANGPLDPDLRAALARRANLRVIEADTNLGIGAALNLIALAAVLDGCARLIVFDQDSRAGPDLVGRIGEAFDRLVAQGRDPSAVGPRLVTPAGDTEAKPPRYRVRPGKAAEGGLAPVDFLPTSGTLFDLATLRRTGFFRADYFIDAVDVEWCFRAWARGGSCWLAGAVPMEHTVGTGSIPLPFGFRMPRQRPFRMYCHLRNTLYGFRLPHIPLRWKARQAAYLGVQVAAYAVHHRGSRAAVAPLLAGLWDGLRGRLGVPPGAPGT